MGTVNESMSTSILLTIKDQLGLPGSYDKAFDGELLVDINSAISILQQLGLPIDETFEVSSDEETWSDLLGGDYSKYKMVKTYLFAKVKLMFDPPTNGVLLNHYKDLVNEHEFRLNIKAESKL